MANASEKYLPWVYESYKGTIQRALANNMPEQVKFILLGRIFCSGERDEISSSQYRELEDLLGLSPEQRIHLSFAIDGEPADAE
jgi:hypothetical protein